MAARQYILYDARAMFGDTADASVLVACDSDAEALSYRGEFGAAVCYSYRIDADGTLRDERFEWGWSGYDDADWEEFDDNAEFDDD